MAWTLGQAAIIGGIVLGIWRIGVVRPGDEWPEVPDGGAAGWAATARWMPWVLRLAVASLLIPMATGPENLGFADWDFVLDKFEAVRRTILDWHQFPWWHPWCRGGFPLAAEPQIGVVSVATPLILAFGTSVGLRFAAVLSIGIAVEGAYRLARLWLREPWAAAVAALIYGLNGAVSVDTANGYIIAMSYGSVPWLAYHAFRIGDGLAQGVRARLLGGLRGPQRRAIPDALRGDARGRDLAACGPGPTGRRPPGRRPADARRGGHLPRPDRLALATMVPLLLQDRREQVTSWGESLLSAIR